MSRRRVDGVKVDIRAVAGPFAPLLRPSYKSLEAETTTVPTVESRHQTPFFRTHARSIVRSISYGCKEAAVEVVPGCHRKGGCAARRSPVVVFTPFAGCPSALILGSEAAFWEMLLCGQHSILTARGICAPSYAIEET